MNSKTPAAILTALLQFGLCAHVSADSLSTSDGATYNNITSQRADPDGVFIEYTLPGGGVGMAKVKFSRMSNDQKKQFGYDASKANDYETQQAKGVEAWRADAVKFDQDSRAMRASLLVQENQRAALENDRLRALAELQSVQFQISQSAGQGQDFGYGGWSGLVAIPEIPNHQHENVPRQEYNRSGLTPRVNIPPIFQPAVFPRANSTLHGSTSRVH